MSNAPDTYDFNSYVTWHDQQFSCNLLSELGNLRDDLKHDRADKLGQLEKLLTKARVQSIQFYLTSGQQASSQNYALPDRQFQKRSPNYDQLFKPIVSIVEKLWRRNFAQGSTPSVSVTNIHSHIKDLIRTSVISTTLSHARVFSNTLRTWNQGGLMDARDRRRNTPDILSVDVDDEAKLASGYFAYHASIVFKDHISIELQVYSQISSAWRLLAHELYGQTRIGTAPEVYPQSPAARLVSLGHLIHLAECELERLATPQNVLNQGLPQTP